MAEPSKSIKVVTIGDGAVGKTCIFPEDYVPTIFDNYTADIDTTSHGRIRLNLWDTAGQEDYDNIRGLAYKEVDTFLIAFSKWFPSIINSESSGANIILVGTKMDLRDDDDTIEALAYRKKKPISTAEAQSLMKEIGAVEYVECASITGEGLKEVFSAAVKASLNKKKSGKCAIL
eukprot:GSMAST32.ASY1.ANO1.950.1 assembled CDS